MTTETKIGLRVRQSIVRPDAELLAPFGRASTGNVCDAHGRGGAMDHRIRPLDPTWRCVGPALTVSVRPVDNLLIYKAMALAQPGDVLVIAVDASTSSAVIGDRMAAVAKALGVAGIVVDGMVRDLAGLLEVDLPVFARGICPNSPWKDGPGEVNFPISCGGRPVHPGDLVIGDGDGVVVVARQDVPAVVRGLDAIFAREESMAADLASGRLIPAWLDETLRAKGVQIVP